MGDLVWNALVESGFEMKELERSSPSFDKDVLKLDCAEDTESPDWIQLESGELFTGKQIDIQIKDVEYPITLDKKMIGVRLNKSEFDNISYRIKRMGDRMVLSLKKYFPPIPYGKKKEPLVGTEYTIVRSYFIA